MTLITKKRADGRKESDHLNILVRSGPNTPPKMIDLFSRSVVLASSTAGGKTGPRITMALLLEDGDATMTPEELHSLVLVTTGRVIQILMEHTTKGSIESFSDDS